MLEPDWRELEKSEFPWENNFFTADGVFPSEVLAYQVSLVFAANWPR